MRIARKLAVLALAAIAAMAFTATAASAKGGIQVVDEATGESCGTTGCYVHMVGIMTLYVDFGFEYKEATCATEFEMTIDGSGYSTTRDAEFSPGDQDCTNGLEPAVLDCNLPWAGSGEEDDFGTDPEIISSSMTICVKGWEAGSTCSGTINFDIVESGSEEGEHYDAIFNSVDIPGSVCELDLNMELEATGGDSVIHVNHI